MFFLPKLTNQGRQPFHQHNLSRIKIPASASTTSHEQNHCVSFFTQITCSLFDCCMFAPPPVTLLAVSLSCCSRNFDCACSSVALLLASASPCCLQRLVLHVSPCRMLSVSIEDTIIVSTHDAVVNAAVVSLAEVDDENFKM